LFLTQFINFGVSNVTSGDKTNEQIGKGTSLKSGLAFVDKAVKRSATLRCVAVLTRLYRKMVAVVLPAYFPC
jgi:hypothetical protein